LQAADVIAKPGEIVRNGIRQRRGIIWIAPRHNAKNRSGVRCGARHWADMVKRIREREDAVPTDPSPGRLYAGQAASRGRETDRPARIGTERAVAQAGRSRDAGTGRGRPDPIIDAPWIERRLVVRVVARIGAL